ncbi:MAG: hypothetical protein JOS17DRAFT_447989 [Linnemannia elongata]|nr:MAG: hypothetical protein JOS17DRAFT_447989 [Linnemannia elongata]
MCKMSLVFWCLFFNEPFHSIGGLDKKYSSCERSKKGRNRRPYKHVFMPYVQTTTNDSKEKELLTSLSFLSFFFSFFFFAFFLLFISPFFVCPPRASCALNYPHPSFTSFFFSLSRSPSGRFLSTPAGPVICLVVLAWALPCLSLCTYLPLTSLSNTPSHPAHKSLPTCSRLLHTFFFLPDISFFPSSLLPS